MLCIILHIHRNLSDINYVNQYGETGFTMACVKGHTGIVELLLNNRNVNINDVNKYGYTGFTLACVKGHIGIVELLLKNGNVNINHVNKYGYNGLSIAIELKNAELVTLLLTYDAIMNDQLTACILGKFVTKYNNMLSVTQVILGDMDICSICLEPFSDGSVCVISCKHMFHTTCLMLIICTDRICPLCRCTFYIFVEYSH